MLGMTARRSAAACALALALPAGAARASEPYAPFSVDVVADCNRVISVAQASTTPTAGPVFGDYFMQEGLIYAGRTLAAHCAGGDGCGLNPDGTPEFPAAVSGRWTCYGSSAGDGGATAEEEWPYSTQVYEFDVWEVDEGVYAPGLHALVSHGPQRNDLNVPWERVITGGYGKYKRSAGQVQQTKVGFNQTHCENFTFDFQLAPPRNP